MFSHGWFPFYFFGYGPVLLVGEGVRPVSRPFYEHGLGPR